MNKSVKDFGAFGDNSHDDTSFIQAAINWASASPGQTLYVPAGTYRIAGGLSKAAGSIGLTMSGDGMDASIFRFETAAGLQINGGSGTLCNAEISAIGFVGVATTVLVELQGMGGQRLRRCRFDTAAEGLRFHNGTTGNFTEYCVADTCDFTANCLLPVRYKRASGTDSFNGSGLVGQCTINSSSSGLVCQIDLNCRPYNAPFHAQIWGNGSCTVFANANTSLQVSFHGLISLERFAGTMTLATAATNFEIPFVGRVMSSNENIRWGALFTCDFLSLTASGGRQVNGGRYSKSQAMAKGANTVSLPYAMSGGAVTYLVHLTAANYDYRYEVKSFNGGQGGVAPITATFATFNAAGYGAPTFAINASQQLVVTNAAWPTSGVTLTVDCLQTGQTQDFPFISA